MYVGCDYALWQLLLTTINLFCVIQDNIVAEMPYEEPPKKFYDMWGSALSTTLASRMISGAPTTTWVMQCGGSMGQEAFHMLQGLEGLVPLRVQIQVGTNVLGDLDEEGSIDEALHNSSAPF